MSSHPGPYGAASHKWWTYSWCSSIEQTGTVHVHNHGCHLPTLRVSYHACIHKADPKCTPSKIMRGRCRSVEWNSETKKDTSSQVHCWLRIFWGSEWTTWLDHGHASHAPIHGNRSSLFIWTIGFKHETKRPPNGVVNTRILLGLQKIPKQQTGITISRMGC